MARPVTAWGSLPFAEQIAFFNGKVDMPTQSWLDLLGAGHDRAFVVAGAMKADLLADLHAAVLKAIEQGTTLDTFRKDFNSIVAKRGWTGWTGEDTPGGRAWRQEIIYGTNLRTSYQAGRHAQAQDIAHRRPYWRYVHNDTVKDPRELHKNHPPAGWNGLILRADNEFWARHWPPNGWNSLVPWEGVHGHISLGLKARYSGPIVEIWGESGRRLCLTSQHPVLTDRGWVAAGKVDIGSNLFRYRFERDRMAVSSCSDNDNAPPSAEEVFDTLATHGRCTMPGAAFNLYGDMKFIKGDVEIVCSNRELLHDVKAEALQFKRKFMLVASNRAALGVARFRSALFSFLQNSVRGVPRLMADSSHAFPETCFTFALDQHGASVEFNPALFQLRRQGLATDMQAGLQFAQSDSREVFGSEIFRDRLGKPDRTLPFSILNFMRKLFLWVAHRDITQLEIADHRGSSNPVLLSNLLKCGSGLIGICRFFNSLFRQNLLVSGATGWWNPQPGGDFAGHGFTAGPYRDASIYQTPPNAGGSNPNASGDVLDAHASLIEIDRVCKVTVRHFDGHVYDFQTKNGIIISSGGFCVSNCRCRVETLAERDLERMGKAGPDPTPDDGTYEWLDKRTGKTHTLPKGVDPGWDYTPGATRDLIAEVKAKAAGLPGKLGEALAQDVAQLAPNGPDWHARSPSDLDAVLERGRLREAELFGTSSKNMDALADKLKRLEADEEMKFNATFADDSDWRSFEALDSAVAATKKARQAGENAMEKTLKGMRAKIVEAEALLRESGVDIPKATAKAAKIEIKDYGYSLVKDVRSQAADFYKQFGVNAGNVAGIFDDPLRKRAYCQNWGHANGDLINLGDSVADKRTLWHEMGHSVEFTDGTGDVARAWLTRRATGAPIKLNDLLNTDVYRDNEIAFPDYFFDAYVGKDYGSSTTEVLSMGLENFISAKSLLDFWLKDREHFRLILGLLRL